MNASHIFLLVDIGNTCMVFGLYRGDTLTGHWQLSSEGNMTSDELALKLHGLIEQLWGQVLNGAPPISCSDSRGEKGSGLESRTDQSIHQAVRDSRPDPFSPPPAPKGILAASVVPHLDGILTEACRKIFNITPAFVGAGDVKTRMAVDYKNPREVGADRIANAVAAREQFGSPVIVLDCGTATTFDIVSPQGHYAGGLILPGVELALAALCRRAARLPEVSFGKIETLIGRDTVSSMKAGSYWGSVESLNGIIHRIHALSGYEHAPVIATGGQSKPMLEDIPGITEYRSRLTLEGLLLLAKRHFEIL